jgi:hypothetical protein
MSRDGEAPPVQATSEKIRAVIYPGQQSWNRNGAERQEGMVISSDQKGQAVESGLAQLSRMIEEQKGSAQASQPAYPAPQAAPSAPLQEPAASWQMMSPAEAAPLATGSPPLRVAPIQDIPSGRDDYPYGNGARGTSFEGRGQSEAMRPEHATSSGAMQSPPATPLSVLASMMANTTAPISPTPAIIEQEVSPADVTLETTMSNGNGHGRATEQRAGEGAKLPYVDPGKDSIGEQRPQPQASTTQIIAPAIPPSPLASPPTANGQEQATQPAPPAPEAETTLLDIMQSLPPMSAPTPQQSAVQPSVLTGRATRSLGSVLLEGHLVPQDRLEVAQNIQRMLRGVDMNYQLGEILLMFKLLTPDQLLAASLVSYGLLTTAQIRALGRIRQELHSIGLEYDLENLLILFRILSPEQLREVRASWNA